jgi:type II secretory pathway pseudopilin PulG
MRCGKSKNRFSDGLTLIEMVIAMAMMVVIFLAIVPIFYAVRKGWDLKEADAEVLQSGRVFIDHISRTLAQAREITEVGDPCDPNGHIVFVANDGNEMEYTWGTGYITYGLHGVTHDMAGIYTSIRYACYDGNDFNTPLNHEDPNALATARVVKVNTTLTHPTKTGHEKDFETTVYLRTKASDATREVGLYEAGAGGGGTLLGDNMMTPAVVQIDSTHYLYAYRGEGDDGYARVLTVNNTDWSVSLSDPCEFDTVSCYEPALVKIDPNHYLCAYRNASTSPSHGGWAVVLEVNLSTWAVKRKGTVFRYTLTPNGTDKFGYNPALAKVDAAHYMVAYKGDAGDGFATILAVNPTTWQVTRAKTTDPNYLEYDTSDGMTPALAQVDSTHYLCAYGGSGNDGFGVILIVNTGTWAVTKGTAFEYDTANGLNPALMQINSTKYLCAYEGNQNDGYAVVLNVNTTTWAVTKAAAALNYEIEYDVDSGWTPEFSKVNSTEYFCAWESYQDDGAAGIFVVDANNWTLSIWMDTIHYTDVCATPSLATQIDPNHFICLYNGSGTYIYANIFEIYLGGGGGESEGPVEP